MSIEEEKAKSPEQEQDQEHLKDSKLSSKDDSINKKMEYVKNIIMGINLNLKVNI